MILATLPVIWGEYSLAGAMLTAVGVVMAALAFWRLGNPGLIRFMRMAQVLVLASLSLASWVLLEALLNDNFKIGYVAAHSEKTLAEGYKVAAFWAGQEGSLLLWAWVLAIMSSLMAWRLRKSDDAFAAITLTIMTVVTGFFTCVMLFAGDPFAPAAAGRAVGMGLNPALQNLAMVFHPPMLFLGYAGFTAPFAYLVAGLLTARSGGASGHVVPAPGKNGGAEHAGPQGTTGVLAYASDKVFRAGRGDGLWLYLARPWMVYSWIVLTVGILLGAQWAYVELGWGGYWAWDAVENASLLPWLTGTALLHAAILQTRRGIFKRWTAWLTAASFFLCILGTYLTRSGVIESVHAFQQSDIGYYFLAFLGAILVGSLLVTVLATVRKQLEAEHPLEALVSREGFFLLGIVLLVIMTVTVGVGTLYPLISGAFGPPVTVSAPFYNKVILPMALLLAALMSTGPVLGSGAEALDRARGKLGGMLLAGVAAAGFVFLLGYSSLWALGAAVTVGAVVAAVVMDVMASLRSNSLLKVIAIRHRHWGAQLAHLGLAAIVAGIAGSSLYGLNKTIRLHPNADPSTKAERTIGGYTLELGGMAQERRPNHVAAVATVNLTGPNGQKFTLKPERRFYDQDPEQGATEVALRMGIFSDVYLTLAGAEADGSTVSITTLINPLVNWIWIGGALLTLGGLVCLIPGKADAAPQTIPPALPETEAAKGVLNGKSKRERRRALSFNSNAIIAGRRP